MIQKLAERVVRLCVLDEVAAITQVRPPEQIADWSGRACHLGDGLSRHDLEHREQMRYQAFAIRELTLDQLLDEGDDGQGPCPSPSRRRRSPTPFRLGRP